MRRKTYNDTMRKLNELMRDVCESFENAAYLDTAEIVGDQDGRFIEYMQVKKRLVKVRTSDGIHLTDAGAWLAIDVILRRIDGYLAFALEESEIAEQGKKLFARSGVMKVKILAPLREALPMAIPDIDMKISRFDIYGLGPDYTTFYAMNYARYELVMDNLSFGTWTVKVNSKNSEGKIIDIGRANIDVGPGKSAQVEVALVPGSGQGRLLMSMAWPAGLVGEPELTLTPLDPVTGQDARPIIAANGSEMRLPSGIYNFSATFVASSVPCSLLKPVLIMPGGITRLAFEIGSSDVLTAPAAPANLTITAVSDDSVNLVWVDGSINEQGFRLERRTPEGAWEGAADLEADVTQYTDTGLDFDTGYVYRLEAYNAYGSSAYSNLDFTTTDFIRRARE